MHSNFTAIARQLQFSSPFLRLNVSDIVKLILHSRAIAPSSRITPGNDVSICQNRRKCTEGSLNLFYTSGSFKGTKKFCAKMKQNKMGMGWDLICWDMLGLKKKVLSRFNGWGFRTWAFLISIRSPACGPLENFLRYQSPKLFVGADLLQKNAAIHPVIKLMKLNQLNS